MDKIVIFLIAMGTSVIFFTAKYSFLNQTIIHPLRDITTIVQLKENVSDVNYTRLNLLKDKDDNAKSLQYRINHDNFEANKDVCDYLRVGCQVTEDDILINIKVFFNF